MKRKILVLLCLVAFAALSLASCEFLPATPTPGGSDTCVHTRSEKWSVSTTQHWHAATCEHSDLKFDVGTHSDVDENGGCDVCGYAMGHTHTYANTWKSDATHHWLPAICSHKDKKGELAAHLDDNFDGKCDVCSAHVHVEGIDGYCTFCGEKLSDIDTADLDSVISVIVANSVKINAGTIAYNYYSTTPSIEGYISTDKTVTYKLGKTSAYYKIDTTSQNSGLTFSDTVEKWYDRLDNDSVFGVYTEINDGQNSGHMLDGSSTKDNLVGYYYSVSTLADAYGAENILDKLYGLSASAFASDYTEKAENGKYSFAFNYTYFNTDIGAWEDYHVDYYEVEVSFTVSETGALTSLLIVCDCYNNSLEDEIDNDFTYDKSTGKVTLKDGAAADTYTFSVSQTEGERTYIPEYTKSDFVPESFDIFTDSDCTDKLGNTVTATEGTTLKFYLGNFYPAGTGVEYIIDTFECDSDLYNWIFGNSISLYCGKVGEYPVVILLGDKEFTFTVTVVKAGSSTPPDIEIPDNGIKVEITNETTYTWDTAVTFTPTESGDYVFTVPAGLGVITAEAKESYGSALIDPLNPDDPDGKKGGSFTVSILAGET